MNTFVIKLQWRDRSHSEVNQFIYRATEPLDVKNLPEPIATLEPNVESYVDEAVEDGLTYYYIIGSTNGSVVKYSDMRAVNLSAPLFGPGSQTLIAGNEDHAGFFGEVPGSELITMSDLTSQMGVTQGTAQNLDTPWLKFFLDGRILYVAKKNIRNTISYDHLRDLGLVDGNKVITINGLQYRVGLLGGIDDGYSGAVSDGYNQPYTMRSEWTRLMYNVSSDAGIPASYQKQGQIGDNWANYPQDDSANGLNISAGNVRYSWTRNLNPTKSTQAISRGYYSVAFVHPRETSFAFLDRGWRPRLELVTR